MTPSFTLRPYQQQMCDQIAPALLHGPVLFQAPARSGKSKCIAWTAIKATNAGKVVIVLTHRGKIFNQLVDHCGAKPINAKTDHIFIQLGTCYVAMNQTLINRPFIMSQLIQHGRNVLLITDEAHRSDFNKIVDQLPDRWGPVGFTATPAWKWAKHLPKYYKTLIHGPQVRTLIESGNITPIDYYEMRNDLSGLVKSNTGEYTEASQEFVFDRASLYDGLFTELQRFTFNKCIVFCASKKSADALNVQMLSHGYKSIVYYSGLAGSGGSYNLAKFTQLNECNVLVTVSALSEGFDHPPIDFNILYRATGSLPLFIQMGMRGATPYAGKAVTTVLDFGGNNSRFGGRTDQIALTMDRDWNALWQPPAKVSKEGAGVGGIKICPACEFMLSATARSCCNCGFIYPEAEVLLKEGELIRIREEENQARAVIAGRRISTLTPIELASYAVLNDKKAFAMRIAKAHGVSDTAWLYNYATAIGYKVGWADKQARDIAEVKMYEPGYRIDFNDIIVK